MKRLGYLASIGVSIFLMFLAMSSPVRAGEVPFPIRDYPFPLLVTGKVIGVVDGDTIIVRAMRSQWIVDLASVDAPEVDYSGESQGEVAIRARQQLELLLSRNSHVVLGFEEKTPVRFSTSAGIRYAAHVFVYQDGPRSWVNVNRKLLRDGWVTANIQYPYLMQADTYLQDMQESYRKGIGMYCKEYWQNEFPFEFRLRVRVLPLKQWVGDFNIRIAFSPEDYEAVLPFERIFFQSKAQALEAGYQIR